MPMCSVKTNLPRADIPEGFCKDFSHCIADTLGKPIGVIYLSVLSDVMLAIRGEETPCVSVEIQSFETFSEEKNATYAKPIMEFLMGKFNLPAKSVPVLFVPIQRADVATVHYMDQTKK